MKLGMLEVIKYLFDYYLQRETLLEKAPFEVLEGELEELGFGKDIIQKALLWLEDLATQINLQSQSIDTPSQYFRVYSSEECLRLDSECRGFLMFLEQINLLTPSAREMVIDRVMALERPITHIDQLKWIILLVLCNVQTQQLSPFMLEELIFTQDTKVVH